MAGQGQGVGHRAQVHPVVLRPPEAAVHEEDGRPAGPGVARRQVEVGNLVRVVAVGPRAVGVRRLAAQHAAVLGHEPSMAIDLD